MKALVSQKKRFFPHNFNFSSNVMTWGISLGKMGSGVGASGEWVGRGDLGSGIDGDVIFPYRREQNATKIHLTQNLSKCKMNCHVFVKTHGPWIVVVRDEKLHFHVKPLFCRTVAFDLRPALLLFLSLFVFFHFEDITFLYLVEYTTTLQINLVPHHC
jgi:hypothetical protein